MITNHDHDPRYASLLSIRIDRSPYPRFFQAKLDRLVARIKRRLAA